MPRHVCLNQDLQDYRITGLTGLELGTIDTFSKHKRLLSQNNIGISFSYPANPEILKILVQTKSNSAIQTVPKSSKSISSSVCAVAAFSKSVSSCDKFSILVILLAIVSGTEANLSWSNFRISSCFAFV